MLKKPLCIKDFWAFFWFGKNGDGLRVIQDNLNSKNFYAYNPEFDKWFPITHRVSNGNLKNP